MKLIVAIVHPEELGPIQAALHKFDLEQMTVSQVLVRVKKEDGYTLIYRSATIRVQMLTRLKLEIVAQNRVAEPIVAALLQAGFIGEADPLGTGKIVVRSLDETDGVRSGVALVATA